MDVYLIRRNGKWEKYSNCIGVDLTGAQAFGTSITGVAASDILTVTGATPANDKAVFFQSLQGGVNLTTGTIYYMVSVLGQTFKLAAAPGGSALDFTTNITSATMFSANPELGIWTPGYRNQFQTTIRNAGGTSNTGAAPSAEVTTPALITSLEAQSVPGGGGGNVTTITPTLGELSDEAAGAPYRQDVLNVTHWRFQINTTGTPATAIAPPTYLYATWADGDIVGNNPPET